MKRWLTSLFVSAALAGGVLAGMPLHADKPGMSKCCAKAKEKLRSPEMKAAQLCCLIDCSDPVPGSASTSFSAAPTVVSVTDSIASRIAAILEKRAAPEITTSVERVVLLKKFQPKYLQHHSFLI
ncbi:MAG: hypothetical protein ACRD6X_03815 [Pyrinomonadaceae bacterium]